MLRLMLDEMISPNLVPLLWDENVDSIATRDRNLLNCSDRVLWERANDEGRAVVTMNRCDFRRLALGSAHHHGLVLVPSGGTRQKQFDLVMSAVQSARMENAVLPSFVDQVVEVTFDLDVNWERCCSTAQAGQESA